MTKTPFTSKILATEIAEIAALAWQRCGAPLQKIHRTRRPFLEPEAFEAWTRETSELLQALIAKQRRRRL